MHTDGHRCSGMEARTRPAHRPHPCASVVSYTFVAPVRTSSRLAGANATHRVSCFKRLDRAGRGQTADRSPSILVSGSQGLHGAMDAEHQSRAPTTHLRRPELIVDSGFNACASPSGNQPVLSLTQKCVTATAISLGVVTLYTNAIAKPLDSRVQPGSRWPERQLLPSSPLLAQASSHEHCIICFRYVQLVRRTYRSPASGPEGCHSSGTTGAGRGLWPQRRRCADRDRGACREPSWRASTMRGRRQGRSGGTGRGRTAAPGELSAVSGGLAMPARPIWRGHLRLALVSCPVALWNAKHDRAAIKFNLINPKTGNRIRMMTVDAETDEELQRRDLVKGYEFRKNQYLLLHRRGLRQREGRKLLGDGRSRSSSRSTRSTRSTSPAATTWRRTATRGAMSMRCCTRRSQRPAAWRWRGWSIGQRERTIAVRAMAGGLVAHTLDEQRDINDARSIFGDAAEAQDRPGDGAARASN